MKKIGYLIKVTHTEGAHIGSTYFLRKGGHVTEPENPQWSEDVYKTEGICRKVCRQLLAENELDRKCERADEQVRIKRGGSPKSFYIYESCTYEPYPVKVQPDVM